MTRFAAIETRLNSAVVKHLANAVALLAGGETVYGTFDSDYQDVLGQSSSQPTFIADAQALSALVRGDVVLISCASLNLAHVGFSVTELHPEHGLQRLMLRRVV
ncbi:MAG: hypothetical protein QMD17_14005 [Rhodocyclaceae bacterium]|nr:hypothetical protein [Rhodocyclaceae bacterium]